MLQSTRNLLLNMQSSWTKTTMHIVIVCICLPIIFGMPYFDDRHTLEKVNQNGALGDIFNTDSDVIRDFYDYERPEDSYDKLENLYTYRLDDDNDENDTDDESYDIMDNEPATRVKRLGFSYFPYRPSRKFGLKRFNVKGLPSIIKAIRKEEYNPVKRRLAFTPMRGR
ncbi:hypothetical protein ACF0H5_012454 [Mactra antiquata]